MEGGSRVREGEGVERVAGGGVEEKRRDCWHEIHSKKR